MIDNQKYSIILPARIVEYFAATQTATIQISAETIYNDSSLVAQSKKRNPIEGVPVHTPSGGGWAITMPIEVGNTCVIIFSQVGYDHWLYEDKDLAGTLASNPKPWLRRQFNDDDGFAFVGMNTLPRAIQGQSSEDSEWRNVDKTQMISLKKDLSITIDSPTSVTINAPSVVVNTTTAEVNATATCNITSPITNISGILNVDGLLVAKAGMTVAPAAGGGPAASMSGDISITNANINGTGSDITMDGVSLKGHTHNDAESRPTTPPL